MRGYFGFESNSIFFFERPVNTCFWSCGHFGQLWTELDCFKTKKKLLTTVQIRNGKLTTKMSFLALYKLKLIEQFMNIHYYSKKDLTSFEKKNLKSIHFRSFRIVSDRSLSKSSKMRILIFLMSLLPMISSRFFYNEVSSNQIKE